MTYTISTTVDAPFDAVLEDVQTQLADAGFGVLCDIDVEATFREKLDEEFQRYRILGACNPPLAHEALRIEPALGTLLPCNVVVSEGEDGRTHVRAVDPVELLSVVDDPAIETVATDVRERFQTVLASLE